MTDTAPSDPLDPTPLVRYLALTGLALMLSGVALWNLHLAAGDGIGWRLIGVASRMFYPGREGNITTWYSSVLLVGVALGLAGHAVIRRRAGLASWPYASLAALALLLSADEAASMHEQLGRAAEYLELAVPWTFNWLILGIPVAVVAGALILWVAQRIDRRLRRRLTVGGSAFLLGAIGFELVGGIVVTELGGTSQAIPAVLYQGAQFLEEGLEVGGTLIALWATLDALDLRLGLREEVRGEGARSGELPDRALRLTGG